MDHFKKILSFFFGLVLAALGLGFVRSLPGFLGDISAFSLALTLFCFLRQKDSALFFAAGAALGLAFFSGYHFFVWMIVVCFAALIGYFLSDSVFTDQSLFALVALNFAVHSSVFVAEIVFSNLLAQGSAVRLRAEFATLWSGLAGLAAETFLLYLFFLVYRRRHGKRAGRLAHIG